MSQAWNGWYHINGNTYGTWLRGDPRGWRARHHREHVEGDYRNPPPAGTYDRVHALSKRLMAKADRAPVYLSVEARSLARDVMTDSLLAHGVELVAFALDSHHYHLLARFINVRPLARVAPKPTDRGPWASANASPPYITDPPRHYVGIAKMRAAHALAEARLVRPGGVWGKRCKVTPVKDRAHQVAIARYIERHANAGAALWTIRAR
jgi:hypothetical protein